MILFGEREKEGTSTKGISQNQITQNHKRPIQQWEKWPTYKIHLIEIENSRENKQGFELGDLVYASREEQLLCYLAAGAKTFNMKGKKTDEAKENNPNTYRGQTNWKVCNESILSFTTVLCKGNWISNAISNNTEKNLVDKKHFVPSVTCHNTPASSFRHFHSFNALSYWTDLIHLANHKLVSTEVPIQRMIKICAIQSSCVNFFFFFVYRFHV